MAYAVMLGLLASVAGPLGAGCSSDADKRRQQKPNASAWGAAARAKPYVASSRRDVFHHSDCRWAAKISERNLVGYDSPADCIADGYRACLVCKPIASRPSGG